MLLTVLTQVLGVHIAPLSPIRAARLAGWLLHLSPETEAWRELRGVAVRKPESALSVPDAVELVKFPTSSPVQVTFLREG